MKTLNEIFKTNPSLLEQPEVLELVDQFKIQFESLVKKHRKYTDSVTDLVFKSEFFLKDGMPCNEAVSKIFELNYND